ncbi:MAG: mraY [Bacillales bacterium]|nr:mraY [Bacillales bacterium]
MLEQVLFFTIITAFVITTVLLPITIPFFHRLKFGQSIREEGPKGHAKKQGTPTMGGILIVIGMITSTLLFVGKATEITSATTLILIATIGFGTIGFLDDWIKVALKRNLGLTSKQKLLGQLLIAIVFSLVYTYYDYPTTVSFEPLGFHLDLGWAYIFFVIIYFFASTNAVNLTDGLDGLLSGTAAIAFGAFAIIAWSLKNYEVALFCVAAVGAVLGFLVFNAHPARIFMGDMGSLALGGAVGAVAMILKLEILFIIVGGVFVIETLSVIIQVISFKTTGKRVFKMSPIHHHYELSGWSEWKVVTTFWMIGFLFAILGIYIEVWL